jgi:ribosomal protein S18 acetylase RimI-like enzyme
MDFHSVEENLRQSFRVLAARRPRADIIELPGVSIASLGVDFQMFNAAYLSSPVQTHQEMEIRLQLARDHFQSRGIPWSFWICEDWLARAVLRRLPRTCEPFGLRLVAEMPGLVADALAPAKKPLPELDIRIVDSKPVLQDFQAIGSDCFHVPPAWFSQVFDEQFSNRESFACFVGYVGGTPVATAASVPSDSAIGIYNVATVAGYRERGYAEMITRHTIGKAIEAHGARQLVLQATWQGLSLYERMGFRAVARFSVFNSSSRR